MLWRARDTEDLALEKHSITTGPLLYTLMAVRDGEIVAVGRYDDIAEAAYQYYKTKRAHA